jgi:DNA-binding NtrC family response regulator
LLENELFGHEIGAFTDAREAKIGLVEAAKEGTLFLDEIGEMSLALQVKLLRFLENKIFRRVGGTKDVQVDVRIVSATNQDLHEQVAHKRFRADLFYRLNVVPIRIVPLRDRREDILPLIQFFGKDYVGRFNRRSMDLNEEARRILMEYDWPGNVRELKNLVERMVLMDTGDRIGPESLRMALGQNLALSSETPGERIRRIMEEPLPESGVDLEEIVKSLEVDLIEKALNKSEGNQSRSAALLGLGRDKLRYRLKSYKIGKED